MKKYRTHIICTFAIILALAVAFIYNGNITVDKEISRVETDVKASATAETETVGETIEKTEESDADTCESMPSENQTAVLEKETEVNSHIEGQEYTCTLSVTCDTILDNIGLLSGEKTEIVPQDGIIYSQRTVSFSEGESVFDVLLREMKWNNIHMEFVEAPIYNSVYVEGIANLYEFDCGELSGWTYMVNGEIPKLGCSNYMVKNGDIIEWVYTCELGKDVGR